MITLLNGDCTEQLKTLPANSIDSLVTDPPAGIGFMGKEWDSHKGGRDQWVTWMSEVMVEALRVLKPGAHGLVWALPRTSHWTGTALEDAGFEIRDCVYHVFGSGFPKSLNVGKAVDKLQGNEREVVGETTSGKILRAGGQNERPYQDGQDRLTQSVTKGQSPWEGWGTALKPAVECWWLVRKPLEESTVAKNVLEYGTGAINIDASRIEHDVQIKFTNRTAPKSTGYKMGMFKENGNLATPDPSGRWPSHLIHDGSDEVLEHFPQTGSGNGGISYVYSDREYDNKDTSMFNGDKPQAPSNFNDSGSAARFFYCAKPSKRERNEGLDGFEEKTSGHRNNFKCKICGYQKSSGSPCVCSEPDYEEIPLSPNANHHPTVKGQALMRYLITLITPPEGIILDMFMGSGSTGVAAKALGFNFIGIELEADYFEIAKARIEGTRIGESLEHGTPTVADENQLDLFEETK